MACVATRQRQGFEYLRRQVRRHRLYGEGLSSGSRIVSKTSATHAGIEGRRSNFASVSVIFGRCLWIFKLFAVFASVLGCL
ncbi:hypothetical protein L596_022165 [Steinernema carpocapsae]|uniref:Uncharacterized protein n=1 Tax=Steinernema carpocapsae TaxID=34508 RepID=A0A4U5MKY1_STECR|nr:hypothetical protein L596_022165 [Steinernema carpocapsae]